LIKFGVFASKLFQVWFTNLGRHPRMNPQAEKIFHEISQATINFTDNQKIRAP